MRSFVLLALLISFGSARGQPEFSLYRLGNTLPQSNMLNPALAPRFKLVVGLPVISSVRVSADLDSLSFADVFNRSDGESLRLDTALISAKMKGVNYVRLNQSIQLFYLGMTLGKSYVSIGLHEVSDWTINYPGDLVGWAIRGPGHSQYVGKALDIGKLYGKGMAYNNASVSLGRNLGDRLRLGVRLNYLLGIGMLESTKLSGQLIVGIDSVALQTGQIQVNTSGVDFFRGADRSAGDYLNYFLRTKNKGVAWDFGGAYKVTKRLSASVAFTNIGFIHWRDYNRSYHHNPVTYTYRGIDLLDTLAMSGPFDIEDELDSLRGLFKPTETTGKHFRSQLIGKAYAGINYHVFGMNHLNALVAFDLLRNKTNPTFSVGYTLQTGGLLNASIGVTFLKGKIDNIGAGLALRISRVQIFSTSERTQSILSPAHASRADIHAGMNLLFGDLKEDLPPEATHDGVKGNKGKSLEKEKGAASVDSKTGKNSVNPDKLKSLPPVGKQEPGTALSEERNKKINQAGLREEKSHIVVIGTFISRDKAERYSRELRQQSISNKIGYDSERSLYRVYVYRSRDRKEARRMRNAFSKENRFRFATIRLLSIADSKFE